VAAPALLATPLVGCATPSDKMFSSRPGDAARTVRVDDTERSYLIHLPTGYQPGRPVSVVLNFHGGAQDAAQQRELSRLDITADEHGFVVVYPQGTPDLIGGGRSWNAGSCCARAQRIRASDVAFTSAVLDDLEQVVSVDPRRIFATGMSNGGMLAYRLACELSTRVAAVAVVAAALVLSPCRPVRPVSVLHIHGTTDPIVPVQGGVGSNPLLGSFPSVAASVAVFARADGCGAQPTRTQTVADARMTSYAGCRDGSAVETCLISGGGHTWPGGAPFPAGGATSTRTSASELAWQFLSDHPMPDDPTTP
jgi:polyhydroxybutyrate depolymerase